MSSTKRLLVTGMIAAMTVTQATIAADGTDDTATEKPPVVAEPVVLQGGPMPAVIVPPPDGFIPVSASPALIGVYAAKEKTPGAEFSGRWFKIGAEPRRTIWEAKTMVDEWFRETPIPLSDFKETQRQLSVAKRPVESLAAPGGHSLPPHFLDERSIQWSRVFVTHASTGADDFDCNVRSLAVVWVDGRLLSLCVGTPTGSEEDILPLVEESRVFLRAWVDALYATNGIAGTLRFSEERGRTPSR
ncbi:MAG: hypothetical protein IJQ73_03530 [Kiritimatiellae bacterium]|nr:hypothetical protein [Kiritimatiellia bacterium]